MEPKLIKKQVDQADRTSACTGEFRVPSSDLVEALLHRQRGGGDELELRELHERATAAADVRPPRHTPGHGAADGSPVRVEQHAHAAAAVLTTGEPSVDAVEQTRSTGGAAGRRTLVVQAGGGDEGEGSPGADVGAAGEARGGAVEDALPGLLAEHEDGVHATATITTWSP